MNDNNSSKTTKQPQSDQVGSTPIQVATAARVPFVLRAWWLREFKEYGEFDWCGETQLTGPLWSSYSDPLCDSGSLDFSF